VREENEKHYVVRSYVIYIIHTDIIREIELRSIILADCIPQVAASILSKGTMFKDLGCFLSSFFKAKMV
jgi:hypothetical protein